MSHDAEKRAEDMIHRLRKLKGLCPMTPEEADAAYDAAPSIPISRDKIRSIIESVMSGEFVSWEPVPDRGANEHMELGSVESESLQLFRNKGDDDGYTSEEDNLREEMLSDEQTEDQNGVDSGETPPVDGG